MKLEGHQKRLTVFIGESDRRGRTPLATGRPGGGAA
jgi:hypothetical protein